MPPLTLRIRIIFMLRRFGAAYRLARAAKNCFVRIVSDTGIEIARIALSRQAKLGPPRGCYSILDQLRKPIPIEGRIILEDQGAPMLPEPSLQAMSGMRQHLEQPWPVFWSRHANARLVGPGLALVNSNKALAIESAYGRDRAQNDPGYRHIPLRAPCRLAGRWTSVMSLWVPSNQPTNYAHWMLESLPRLAAREEWPDDTGILVPFQLLPFQKETLDWLNLTEHCRATAEQHIEVEDYYFTSPPTMIVCHNPYGVEFLRSRFLRFGRRETITNPRIFLHRRGQFRQASNDVEIVDFFRGLGWAIVDTARLSVAEQIQHFSQAEAVCGLHGAGFTNLAWCRPGCRVIELLADGYLSGCYEWLSYCVKARHRFLVFPSDHAFNIRIELEQLRSLLREERLA